MTCKPATCSIRLALLLLLALSGSSGRCANLFPPVTTPSPSTNHYHATFIWDQVTNATSYQVIARSNGLEVLRIPCGTNFLTVSNLPGVLDGWQFTCVSSNAVLSDESNPAVLKLITLLEGETFGQWRPFTTPVFEPTNQARFFWPSNFNANSLLKPD